MNTRVLKIGRWVLLVWGGVSLVAVLVIAVIVLFMICSQSRTRVDTASPHDVRFVLNSCGLDEERIERVVHSYQSARSGPGDHLDAYAIMVSKVDIAQLRSSAAWHRGDQLPKVVEDAVVFAGAWARELPWFPGVDELRTAEFYVYPWSIYYHGLEPTTVNLIFVRPSDKMVFYLECKT